MREGLVKWARGFGRDLFALQNLGLRGAFNDRRLCSSDVQADYHFLFGTALTNDDCQLRSNRRIASASSFCSCWLRTSIYFVSISRIFFSSSPWLTGTISTSAPLARRRLSASKSSPIPSSSFR